jgi:hypothetical protein
VRFSRVLAAFLVLALAALAVGWRVTSSQQSARVKPAVAASRPAHPRYLIPSRELKRFLLPRRVPRAAAVSGCALDIQQRIGPSLAPVLTGAQVRPGQVYPDQVPVGGNCQGFANTP